MKIYVNGLSVIGPGLHDTQSAQTILRGEKHWHYETMPSLKPAMLPANERRRTTSLIKLSLEAMQDLLRDNDGLNSLSSVFASAYGDLDIADKMCSALAAREKVISPTVFHNSVHNAPAGYWSIAASLRGASTSISAGDATFMVGLMEAVTRLMTEHNVVLYVAYDYPGPERINARLPLAYPLAIALRLGSTPEPGVFGTLTLKGEADKPLTRCRNISLDPLREGMPTGAGLPLIEALCRRARMEVDIPYLADKTYSVIVSH